MSKGKAFLVVGHKHWDKSTTLKALTDDSRYPRRWSIIRNQSRVHLTQNITNAKGQVQPAGSPRVRFSRIRELCTDFATSTSKLDRGQATH
jgi:hypothetical protein